MRICVPPLFHRRFVESGVFAMGKIPISLIIDDPAPRVFVYYEHAVTRTTADGRPLLDEVPNRFLVDFCDVMERWGIRGKFSVVPMPGGRGDIVHGIRGFEQAEIEEWLEIVRTRVSRYFSICPEILTHARAVNLETGALLDENENVWARTQNVKTLTPYIAKALSLLKEAGIEATGVTSPWDFGIEVEADYVAAISAAFDEVYGKKDCWYFLRALRGVEGARPWVALNRDGRRVVSVPATTSDHFWKMMDTTDVSEKYISAVADELITEDGSAGEIIDVMNRDGWPILITHWQSLFANGAGTGLRALELVARRVEKNLSDRVEWLSSEAIMRRVLEHPEQYPCR